VAREELQEEGEAVDGLLFGKRGDYPSADMANQKKALSGEEKEVKFVQGGERVKRKTEGTRTTEDRRWIKISDVPVLCPTLPSLLRLRGRKAASYDLGIKKKKIGANELDLRGSS